MSIALKFGIPSHGWLQVTLRINADTVWSYEVADAPIDSILSLCEALTRLAKGESSQEEIPWFLEPTILTWNLSVEESGQLTLKTDDSEFVIDRREFLYGCIEGLRELGALSLWTKTDRELAEIWEPFPIEQLRQLEEAFSSAEGSAN